MGLEPLRHIEEQDPSFPVFRQRHVMLWLVWAGVTFLAVLVGGVAGLIVAPLAMGWVLLQVMMNVYHRRQVEDFQHYRQLEALMALYALIRIRYPLPPMRLWAISPDFATLIVGTIRRHKPKQIVELGSGTSTVICAYALDSAEVDGRIRSIEHQSEFVDASRRLLAVHGFSDIADVKYAPLQALSLDDVDYQWYATSALDDLQDIDVLIIDGPPQIGEMDVRYPAMAVLFDKLQDDALILVDDYMRPSESRMVDRWLEEFDLELVERIANEKGAAILRKCANLNRMQSTQTIDETLSIDSD